MLEIRAYLERKPDELRPPACRIEKIIELTGKEFADLGSNPFRYHDFITENRDLMRKKGEIWHCLLALDQDGGDGILIEAEGSDYIRYGAYVSHARDIVMKQMEQVADLVIKDAVSSTSSGSWITYFEEFPALTGMEIMRENGFASLLLAALQERPEVAEIEMTDEAFDAVYYLSYCTSLDSDALEAQTADDIKLRDVLLLGDMENVYMIHDTADVGFVPASYTAMLTDTGREEHAELLNASVKEIRAGAYGPEIVLTGIDPELLVSFDRAAAAHEQAEFQMGDPTM